MLVSWKTIILVESMESIEREGTINRSEVEYTLLSAQFRPMSKEFDILTTLFSDTV